MKKIRFCTLYPRGSAVEFYKDVGQIPYTLAKMGKAEATMICCYATKEAPAVPGMGTYKMPRKTWHREWDTVPETFAKFTTPKKFTNQKKTPPVKRGVFQLTRAGFHFNWCKTGVESDFSTLEKP